MTKRTPPLTAPELREQARKVIGALAVPPNQTSVDGYNALTAITSSHQRLDACLQSAIADQGTPSYTYAITEIPQADWQQMAVDGLLVRESGGKTPLAIVRAVNALDALDRYAVSQGCVPYSELSPLHEWIGTDEYGVWGVFTNLTIWAIPIRREPHEHSDKPRFR